MFGIKGKVGKWFWKMLIGKRLQSNYFQYPNYVEADNCSAIFNGAEAEIVLLLFLFLEYKCCENIRSVDSHLLSWEWKGG